jgi:hypothetical protein
VAITFVPDILKKKRTLRKLKTKQKKKKKRERENIVLKKNHQSSLTPLVSSMEQKQE